MLLHRGVLIFSSRPPAKSLYSLINGHMIGLFESIDFVMKRRLRLSNLLSREASLARACNWSLPNCLFFLKMVRRALFWITLILAFSDSFADSNTKLQYSILDRIIEWYIFFKTFVERCQLLWLTILRAFNLILQSFLITWMWSFSDSLSSSVTPRNFTDLLLGMRAWFSLRSNSKFLFVREKTK